MNNPIKLIGCEDWLNVYEKSAKWDIAQSTFASFTMDELMALDGEEGATFYESLNREVMNYGWIEGSPEFKDEVAKLYRNPVSPSRILQTNGCTGANLNAMHVLIELGDHVVAEWPTRRSTRFRASLVPRSTTGSSRRDSAGSRTSRS